MPVRILRLIELVRFGVLPYVTHLAIPSLFDKTTNMLEKVLSGYFLLDGDAGEGKLSLKWPLQ